MLRTNGVRYGVMVLLVVVIGVFLLIGWAWWHERSLHSQSLAADQARSIASDQRRQLEAQMLQERAQVRKETASDSLARFEAGETNALDDVADLLHASPEPEQWKLIRALNRQLQARYGERPLSAPLPAELPRLLAVLSGRPLGYRQQGEQRDCLQLQSLQWQGLEMRKLNLRGAALSDCRFSEARLPGLDLFAARLQAVRFSKSRLAGLNLTGATLSQCDFEGCDLQAAELITAELVDCNLRGCDLSQAAFRGARLTECDLRGARLTGATGLSFAQLLSCRLDADTRLPDSLQPRLNEFLTRSQQA